MWNRLHQGLFLPPLWLRLHRSPLISSAPLSVSPLCLSKTSWALPPSPHLLRNHLKRVLLLSFKILFIPRFFHLPFWPPCSPLFIKKLPPLSFPPSDCPPCLHPCFLLCCFLASHFLTAMRRHLVFEIAAYKVRCWFHPGFNLLPGNLILVCRELELRAESAKLII